MNNEYEQAVNEMDNAYRLYAFWSHELGICSPIADELYAEFWHARKKVEDLFNTPAYSLKPNRHEARTIQNLQN